MTDLTREDFEVLEDGKPVEITNFYAIAEPVSVVEGQPAPAPAAPADEQPEDQRLYLTILIDNRSLIPATRSRLLKSVREFLAGNLRPEDRVLLASYDGSLHIHQMVSSDPEALLAAVDEIAKNGASGRDLLLDRDRLLREIESADSLDSGDPLGGGESARTQAAVNIAEAVYNGIRLYSQQRYDTTKATLEALSEFVDSLAGLPGRKALLFVSSGMPLRPAEALYQAWESRFAALKRSVGASSFDAQQNDATPLFRKLIDHANSNRVTFYVLGATEELAGTSAERGATRGWSSTLEATERMNHDQSLQMIAEGTGGLAIIDGAGLPFLARMRADFGTYYSLGYVPREGRNGKKRKVEIRTRDRSLSVRHRTAHLAQTDSERMTSRARSALLLGEEVNPLQVEIEFLEEKRNDKGQYLVELMIKFPMANLVLLPQEQFHEGKARLFVGTRDSHGRNSPITEIEVPIRVPNDQLLTALGQTVAFKTNVLLRPEEHVLAVALRDEIGNAESTAKASYTPGRQEPQPAGEPEAGAPGEAEKEPG